MSPLFPFLKYLTDGTASGHEDYDSQQTLYISSLIYSTNDGAINAFKSASFNDGWIVGTNNGRRSEVHNFLTDHLGSVRQVVAADGSVIEQNDYYPFGKRWVAVAAPISDNRHRFSGKEEQAFLSLPYVDFGARMYNPDWGRWFTQDPLAEKYYSWAPYCYCINNPVKYVDPNGLDIWEISPTGNITMIKDDKITKISFVNQKGEETKGYEFSKNDISYREDKDQEGNSIYLFEIKGDDKAEQIYNRSLVHTQNKQEFELVRIGDDTSERNIVGTSQSHAQSGVGTTLLNRNYTIREHYHNHPSGNNRPSNADKTFAKDVRKYNPKASFYINVFQRVNGRTRLTKNAY